jgi:hypothetical protein
MYTTLGERQGLLATPPLPEAPVELAELRDHRDRRRAWIAAAAVAVVVALLVASFAIVRASTSDNSARVKPIDDRGTPQAIFPTPAPHTGAELYLVPSAVPAGYSLLRAYGPATLLGGYGSFPGSGRGQSWVRVDAAGVPVASFGIGWQPTDVRAAAAASPNFGMWNIDPQQLPADALAGYDDAVPADIAGTPGIWSERLQTYGWIVDDQTVTVTAANDSPYGAWPQRVTQEQLLAIAEAVVRRPDGGFTLGAAPAGFQLAGEQPSWITVGENTRKLVYSDGAQHGIAISLDDNSDVSPGITLAQPEAKLVAVRTVPAVFTPFANGGDGHGCVNVDLFMCGTDLSAPAHTPSDRFATYVQWLEADGTLVTVTGVGLDASAVLDIARNLHEVSEAEWQQLVTSTPNR